MALQPTRLVFRLTLSNVDRGVEREEPVNVSRHPSETQEHVVLRLLAWCLFWEEQLEFGPGLSTPDTPDLWARDLTGRLTLWVECRGVDGPRLKKIVSGSSGAKVAFLVDDARRAEELKAELAGWKKPPNVEVWRVDHALVANLAARDERQHHWRVTLVGDCFYIDADGKSFEGALVRTV